MFPGVEPLYQRIAEVLGRTAPEGWQKAWVTTTIDEDHGKGEYDYLDAEGKEAWFEPDTMDQYEVYKAFQEILKVMKAADQPVWSKARFELEKTGKFHIDFGYDGT